MATTVLIKSVGQDPTCALCMFSACRAVGRKMEALWVGLRDLLFLVLAQLLRVTF